MSKALLIATIACLMAACATAPPDRSALPDVGEVLEPPLACSFLVGPPQGVSISEVFENTAADGVLEAGDVIVAMDGVETSDSEQLRVALNERSVGDPVDLELRRDGVEESAEMVLGANPDDPERPFMGVMIRTAYEELLATDADETIPELPTTRAVIISGLLYGMEPSGALWVNTGVAIGADTNWVATTESVYALSTGDERVLTDALSGEVIDYPVVEDWMPARLVGAIEDDLLLAVTQEVPDQPELVSLAISRFDPETGDTEWIEPISEGFGIPVTGWGSPESGYITLAGVDPEDASLTGVEMLTADGETAGLDDLLAVGTPIGWLDEATAVFRTSATSVSTVNAVTGKVTEVVVDSTLEGLPLYAVADGHSVLAVSGRSLLIDDLTTDSDVRVLAEDCSIGRVGDTGWRP
ncbi:MAG: PDZ domain-containing protein [Acidimicrobiia bacterium]